jgi:hypothetical protein
VPKTASVLNSQVGISRHFEALEGIRGSFTGIWRHLEESKRIGMNFAALSGIRRSLKFRLIETVISRLSFVLASRIAAILVRAR